MKLSTSRESHFSTNALPVMPTAAVRNIGDGRRESTALFGVFPVSIVQSDYSRTARTAKIRGLPDWIGTEWSGSLTSERTERGIRDNRTLIATNVCGVAAFDITGALTNEIVGGRCVLRSRVGDSATATHTFFIRGKNPRDATARAYIISHVDEEFRSYAWKIAKHESKSGSRVYNQFNPGREKIGLPNKTNGTNTWGWGMAQIDKGRYGGSTAEIYDWHENVASMNNVLRNKEARYLEIITWFRDRYQNDPTVHWIEPNVTTNVGGTVLSARDWSIMTLYNGAGGCDKLTTIGRPQVRSPIHFDPKTSRWRLSTNSNDYVPRVMTDAGAEETE